MTPGFERLCNSVFLKASLTNAGTKLEIGAILTLAGRKPDGDLSRSSSTFITKELFGTSNRMMIEILGRSLVDRALDKVRLLGAVEPTLISEASSSGRVFPSRGAKPAGFIAAWESAVGQHVRSGVELLLLIRMSAYAELDFAELLRFHAETGAQVTQAYDSSGSLDIAVVNAAPLRALGGSYRNVLSGLIPQRRRYLYEGYVNRLNTPQSFRTLVEDGLHGRCELRPMGVEAQPQVWLGEGAQLDSSVLVRGPAFIGAGARVCACCVIQGAASVERNSEVDCGTLVEDSCILADTYVGVGLNVRHAIVANRRLFHLERNVEVGFGDHRLIDVTSKTPALLGTVRNSLHSYLT